MDNIGRYEVKKLLGSGAMADVYLAIDPKIHRTIAIKVLRAERANDEEYRYRFLREASAAGNLIHPNIVTVFDVGEVEQHPYMAMELLEGDSLQTLIDSKHSFTVEEVLAIGIQLAEGLDYSHSKGVVHRDIKPANIVFVDGTSELKITDFGIARQDDLQATHQTQLGTVLGTPQYMAPEQLKGEKVDGRADLFSVGVVLYELLAAAKPFTARSLPTLYMDLMKEKYPRIEERVPDIPPRLAHLIGKLLHRKPGQRYQTGGELSRALQRVRQEIEVRDERLTDSQMLMSLWNVGKAETTLGLLWLRLRIANAVTHLAGRLRLPIHKREQLGEFRQRAANRYGLSQMRARHVYQSLHIPLRLASTAAMFLVIGITLWLCTMGVYYTQMESMRNFTLDSGSALARLLAVESAEPILSEDWVAVETMVEDLEKNQLFTYLYITDHKHIVRGSSELNALNKSLALDNFPDSFREHAGVMVREWRHHEIPVFDFELPVTFQKTRVGTLHLGLSQEPLANAANSTLWMMILLVVITVAAVVLMTYLLFLRVTKPLTLLNQSLVEVLNGRTDERLDSNRTDEFGEVFKRYNRLLVLYERMGDSDSDTTVEQEIIHIDENSSQNKNDEHRPQDSEPD